jgi:hypothetical protein
MAKMWGLIGGIAVLLALGLGVYFKGRHDEHVAMQAQIDKLTEANGALDRANKEFGAATETQNAALTDLRKTCEAADRATKVEAAKVEKVAADRDAIAKQLRAARGAVSADQSCTEGLRIVRERMRP